jgi:FKBP-type peptidyl-prolyl cis-trans isomerase FklB
MKPQIHIMKSFIIATVTVSVAALSLRAEDAPKDPKDKISYSIGVDIGRNMKRSGIDINPAMLAKGLGDAVSGNKTALTDEEMQQTLQAFQTEMRAKAMKSREEAGDKNKAAGEAFLAENKKKEGVVTLPSGLQYKIVTAGKGEKPKSTDTVVTNYRGTLIDGTEFDSSYKRGEPASFPVNGVIAGWTEALQLMPVGSKWQLFIPSNLAYGPSGPPGSPIGPNSTLLFDIELLSIKKP